MFRNHVTPRECFVASLAYTMQMGQRSDAGDPANRDEFLKSAKV